MTRRTFAVLLVSIFAAGIFMRVAWLRADPPTVDSVGIVWHDEGAWTHNARNRALWGMWRTDDWNPLFIAPVFTASNTPRSRPSAWARGRRAWCRSPRAWSPSLL